MPPHAVYLFQARHIQDYVRATAKLKYQVGASELIEGICAPDGMLDQVIEALEQRGKVRFARRNGGAFIAVFTGPEAMDQARRLQALWTLYVGMKIPGLRFDQGLGQDPEDAAPAIRRARDQSLGSEGLLFPRLPLVGPLCMRAPRTGEAAMGYVWHGRGEDADLELLDEPTQAKDSHRKGRLVTDKFSGIGPAKRRWPRIMPKAGEDPGGEPVFPLPDQDQEIGILHADINDLGRISRDFFASMEAAMRDQDGAAHGGTGQDFTGHAREFSRLIEEIMTQAARAALRDLDARLDPDRDLVWPLRPLVLAGDDLTVILRAAEAVPFARVLLRQVSVQGRDLIRGSALAPWLPEQLTACAGLAFIKAGQPFHQAYALSESLCAHAKQASKRHPGMPPALAFHRVTGSLIEDYAAVLRRDLRLEPGRSRNGTEDGSLLLTMQPYFISTAQDTDQDPARADGEEPGHGPGPRLDLLERLTRLLDDPEAEGPAWIRSLLARLRQDQDQADRAFSRWRGVHGQRHPERTREIVALLQGLTGSEDPARPYLTGPEEGLPGRPGMRRTPLGDALALYMAGRGQGEHGRGARARGGNREDGPRAEDGERGQQGQRPQGTGSGGAGEWAGERAGGGGKEADQGGGHG